MNKGTQLRIKDYIVRTEVRIGTLGYLHMNCTMRGISHNLAIGYFDLCLRQEVTRTEKVWNELEEGAMSRSHIPSARDTSNASIESGSRSEGNDWAVRRDFYFFAVFDFAVERSGQTSVQQSRELGEVCTGIRFLKQRLIFNGR